MSVRPPKLPLDVYCDCTRQRHVRKFLPTPETDAERDLIETYLSGYVWPDAEDLRQAVDRFMRFGATEPSVLWARQGTEARIRSRCSQGR